MKCQKKHQCFFWHYCLFDRNPPVINLPTWTNSDHTLDISRYLFVSKELRKYAQSSPARARYGVSFYEFVVWTTFQLRFILCPISCYIWPWYIESVPYSICVLTAVHYNPTPTWLEGSFPGVSFTRGNRKALSLYCIDDNRAHIVATGILYFNRSGILILPDDPTVLWCLCYYRKRSLFSYSNEYPIPRGLCNVNWSKIEEVVIFWREFPIVYSYGRRVGEYHTLFSQLLMNKDCCIFNKRVYVVRDLFPAGPISVTFVL